jgi:DNA-directed RNA polymerase subunit H (RpoH/RPB5)
MALTLSNIFRLLRTNVEIEYKNQLREKTKGIITEGLLGSLLYDWEAKNYSGEAKIFTKVQKGDPSFFGKARNKIAHIEGERFKEPQCDEKKEVCLRCILFYEETFKLKKGFLRQTFKSKADLFDRMNRNFGSQGSLRTIPKDSYILNSHKDCFKSISSFLENVPKTNKIPLLIFKGPVGIGKLTILSEYVSISTESKLTDYEIIVIKCDQMSFDLVQEEFESSVNEILMSENPNTVKSCLFETLKANKKIKFAFVLDRVRGESDESVNFFEDIKTFIKKLYNNKLRNTLLILLIHSPFVSKDYLNIFHKQNKEILYEQISITGLIPSESMALFKSISNSINDDEIIKNICEKLNHHPKTISIIAHILNDIEHEDNNLNTQRLIASILSNNIDTNKLIAQYADEYLKILNTASASKGTNYAFLCLLSLTISDTYEEIVKDVIRNTYISSVNNKKVSSLLKELYPWVTKNTNGKINIDPLVKAYLYRSMVEIASKKTFKADKCINREEIAEIHCSFASSYHKVYKPGSYTKINIGNLHGLIFHLFELKKIFGDNTNNDDLSLSFSHYEKIYKKLRQYTYISEYCYYLVEENLLNKNQDVTRVHGLYEEKRRLLYSFFNNNDFTDSHLKTNNEHASIIVHELALGEMHNGNLLIAKNILDSHKLLKCDYSNKYIKLNSSLRSTGALINLRLGNDINLTLSHLNQCLKEANEFYLMITEQHTDPYENDNFELLKPAITILTRCAQLQFLQNNRDYVEHFKRAIILNRILKKDKNAYLTGYSGRKYIQTLLRKKETQSNVIDVINYILKSKSTKNSNDRIPLFVLMSAYYRMNHALNDAKGYLNQAEELIDNINFNCPYSFYMELEIEKIRHNIFQIGLKEIDQCSHIIPEIKRLQSKFALKNQTLYINDLNLIMAEIIINREERENILSNVGLKIDLDQYPKIRENDIDAIREYSSAMERYGI